jgi:hypothetical protein
MRIRLVLVLLVELIGCSYAIQIVVPDDVREVTRAVAERVECGNVSCWWSRGGSNP